MRLLMRDSNSHKVVRSSWKRRRLLPGTFRSAFSADRTSLSHAHADKKGAHECVCLLACSEVIRLDHFRVAPSGHKAAERGEKTRGRHVGHDVNVHCANILPTAADRVWFSVLPLVDSLHDERHNRSVRGKQQRVFMTPRQRCIGQSTSNAQESFHIHKRGAKAPAWTSLTHLFSSSCNSKSVSELLPLRSPQGLLAWSTHHQQYAPLRWKRSGQHNSRPPFRARSSGFLRGDNDAQAWSFTVGLLQPVGPIPPQVVFQESFQSTISTQTIGWVVRCWNISPLARLSECDYLLHTVRYKRLPLSWISIDST
ncbi:hypothetical protein T09_3815 [Trichinella sp. T9]|nr:hypothetical protein T09_3815 [Trichinella sp. T9]